MLTVEQWSEAERYIGQELEYTAGVLRGIHGLEPDFTREQVSDHYKRLKIGAGADRIAWATARDQAKALPILKEQGLPTTLESAEQKLHSWSTQIFQAGASFGPRRETRSRIFQSDGLLVARMHWGGVLEGVKLSIFSTIATSPEGYIAEMGIDIVRGSELVATVDGNRSEPEAHIHISGEDPEKPWHYSHPPTLAQVIRDSVLVVQYPSYLERSGKFFQRAA